MAFIFWNENDAVVSYETAKVVWDATYLDGCMPRADQAGKLVLAPCSVYAPDLAPQLPPTLSPFLQAFSGSQLQWNTEVYLYKEEEHESCHKDSKGGRVCTKYYSCSLAWSDVWIDSSSFRCPDHPSNQHRTFPQGLRDAGSIFAPEYSVVLSHDGAKTSGLALDSNLQQQLPSADLASRLKHSSQGWTASYQRLGGSLTPQMLQVNGGYLTTYQSQPQIGDLRISMQGRSATTATAAAKQLSGAYTPGINYRLGVWPPQKFGFFGKETKPLEKLLPGRLSPSEFVEAWDSEISTRVWMMRLVAFVAMFIAFELILQPLSVAADLLRMLNCCTCGLGSVLDGAAQCVINTLALTASFCLFLVTVAVAWVVARPLLGIFLLAAAIALLFGACFAHKKRSSRVALIGGSSGLMSGTVPTAPNGTATPQGIAMPVATAMPVAAPVPVQQCMQVTCPAGVQPGQFLTIQGPSGQTFTAEVPVGVRPGQAFNVQMPP